MYSVLQASCVFRRKIHKQSSSDRVIQLLLGSANPLIPTTSEGSSDVSRFGLKKFTGEELREQKIARFRKQKELKVAMERLRIQHSQNHGDESVLVWYPQQCYSMRSVSTDVYFLRESFI